MEVKWGRMHLKCSIWSKRNGTTKDEITRNQQEEVGITKVAHFRILFKFHIEVSIFRYLANTSHKITSLSDCLLLYYE